jgi:hypothetical protein
MNASGRAVTRTTTLDRSVRATGQTFALLSGDELVYLTGATSRADAQGPVEFVAYRVRLR